jgi:hypothetical protein
MVARLAPSHGRFLGKGVARITRGEAVAKAAGLTCIAVPLFVETDVSAADRVVQSLEELLAPERTAGRPHGLEPLSPLRASR